MWLPSSFKDCPSCKENNSYGTIVHKSTFGMPSLIDLCKVCGYFVGRSLPSLNKKVIYLDQFFIGDVSIKNDSNGFVQMYEVLRNLYKQQLVVCPYSSFHKTESLVDDRSNSFQKTYEHLSNGVSFFDPVSIYEREIISKFLEVFDKGKTLTVDDILYGSRNDWIRNFICSIPLMDDNILNHTNEVDRLELIKKNNRIILESFLQDCKQNRDVTIDKKKYYKIMRDKIIDDLATSLQNESFLEELRNHYGLEVDSIKNFLREYIKTIPSVKIMAHLAVSLAHQYVFNKQQSIPASMFNDIHIVSSILPYCDAIFIDKKLHALFEDYKNYFEDYPDYKDKLFSLRNKEFFLNYLTGLEENVSTFDKELFTAIYPSSNN
jgi:hypothetical protein